MRWRDEAHAAAIRHGIQPSGRFVAQIALESCDFDTGVISQHRLGPTGARGIAQFMTPTGNWVASMIGVGQDEFWSDPARQLDGAAWTMRRLLIRYSERQHAGRQSDNPLDDAWVFALAAHHAGSGNLVRWLDRRDNLTPFDDTIRYVGRIMILSEDEVRARLLPPRLAPDAGPLGALPALVTARATRTLPRAAPVPMPTLALDAAVPFSVDDPRWAAWTCSLHAVQQALEAVGSTMSYAEVYRLMADVRRPFDGEIPFLDQTGQLLARMFRAIGYAAYAEYPVDFDRIWDDAGHEPICLSIGGHNRWMFVRSRADNDTLNLSNSAPGHKGVEQTITRWQWAQVGGGAAAVHIEIPEGEDASVIAALQARLVELVGENEELGRQVHEQERRVTAIAEGLAQVTDVIVPAMVGAPSQDARKVLAGQARMIRASKLGPRASHLVV
jgi:transglycosylase-like protein with SLT domain